MCLRCKRHDEKNDEDDVERVLEAVRGDEAREADGSRAARGATHERADGDVG
jgi:hypothetical protein